MTRVALVTGGSRGIGRAVAEKLADSGYAIVVNYSTSSAEAADVVKALAPRTRAIAIQADVSDAAAVHAMAEQVNAEFGRVDVLVNNAGQTLVGDWRTLAPETWNRALEVNLTGVFNCVQAFAPMLTESGDGRIVNIGTIYSDIGNGFVAGYAAAKAGIRSLTRVFAKELAPRVLVNTIAPGDIDTEMTRSAGPDFIAATIEKTPLARLGRPEEIAALVAFLASADAGFITGQTIVCDGGRSIV
ncbi:beta-ketoacyl-ACP reductase [Acrocarpospora corrugata]|uniref:Beta-ketoacyl-ACP reductase n=1 Tax=Acrocarpospora corrugata TaxID=35763 RepID=A0A5M3WFE5_9ACTN|nr:beta-ketoacyl-ACP reductase [Acrocarpospora corrugata]